MVRFGTSHHPIHIFTNLASFSAHFRIHFPHFFALNFSHSIVRPHFAHQFPRNFGSLFSTLNLLTIFRVDFAHHCCDLFLSIFALFSLLVSFDILHRICCTVRRGKIKTKSQDCHISLRIYCIPFIMMAKASTKM